MELAFHCLILPVHEIVPELWRGNIDIFYLETTTFAYKSSFHYLSYQYMEALLSRGEDFEFFIEGTRSRSGKSVYPKGGLLSVIVDSYNEGKKIELGRCITWKNLYWLMWNRDISCVYLYQKSHWYFDWLLFFVQRKFFLWTIMIFYSHAYNINAYNYKTR